jgi:phage gp16-like protein
MRLAKEPSELAKRYIDASLQARARQGRSGKPSKAAYARAVKLARAAIEELTVVARRAQRSPSR